MRVLRLFEQVLLLENDHPALIGARLADVEVHPGAGMLTAYLLVEDEALAESTVPALEAQLRRELAIHLPRRRTPAVRLRVLPHPERSPEGRTDDGGAA